MDEQWLRVARRILVHKPRAVGLVSAGTPLPSGLVAGQLAQALAILSGETIGVFPPWRSWGRRLPPCGPGVVVLRPSPEGDPIVAACALELAVASACTEFRHLVVDLGGLPLRHPATLACADALVTLAASGGVREEQLQALERVLPPERNLGVMLIA